MPRQSLAAARRRLGFDSFRPGQEEAAQAVLEGRDVLAVLPTGGGKSAIYQLAGAALSGPTVVVSPLIALQHDQAGKRETSRSGGAAVINSAVGAVVQREAFEDLANDGLEFVFLAPEQLRRREVLDELRAAPPSLFVVDEAHCISEWGHDFRPDYLRVGAAIETLGHPRVLALTATAPPDVRSEIAERLCMREPHLVLGDMDRPNIELAVRECRNAAAKLEALVTAVQDLQPPGIVYTATRRHAEEVAAALGDLGVRSAAYHAGLPNAEREAVQEEFMTGRVAVIAATTAFGMGIDKSDVRFVLHFAVPGSLARYYQEIGRAGRDGAPASATLFYRPQDLSLHKFFAGGGLLQPAELEAVLRAVRDAGGADESTLRAATALSPGKVAKAVAELEGQALLELAPSGELTLTTGAAAAGDPIVEMRRRQERHRLRLARELDRMQAYAELHDCRRRYLLEYLGQSAQPCGRCDNCARGRHEPVAEGLDERPFPVKTRVIHRALGKGVVLGYAGARLKVLFDAAGEKTMDTGFVVEHGLLERL